MWKQTRRGKGPGHQWVQLAPNMGAGGSSPRATLDSDAEEEEQQECEECEQESEQAEEVESERVTVKMTEEVETQTDMEDESGTEEGKEPRVTVKMTEEVETQTDMESESGRGDKRSALTKSDSEQVRERERESEREWFGEHLLHPTLCIKHLCFASDQMSSWYSAAAYGWSGSYAGWYERRRGSWCGKSEVRYEVEWFCQKCGAGNWWSRTDCRHCASVTNDDARSWRRR